MSLSPLDLTTDTLPIARAPWQDAQGVWHVTQYADAQAVLNDPDTVVDHSLKRLMTRAQAAWPEKFTHWPIIFEILNISNGDWHSSQRKATAGLMSRMQLDLPQDRLKHHLLAAAAHSGPDGMDVISHVLNPVLNAWVAKALDLDPDQVADMRAVGNRLVHRLGAGMSKVNASDIESEARDLVTVYASAIGRDKMRWTPEDHARLFVTVVTLNAQSAFLANVLEHLADHPDTQETLRETKDARRPYMFEAERFLVSSRYLHRVTGAGGVPLAPGHIPGAQAVMVDLAAGNRDPARWHNPQIFDPSRPARANLAFSYGVHRCLGVNISRKIVPQFLNVFLRTVRAERGAPSTRSRNMAVDLLSFLPLRLSRLDGR